MSNYIIKKIMGSDDLSINDKIGPRDHVIRCHSVKN